MRQIALFALAARLFAATPGQLEFFERNVRPVLARHCHSCHSAAAKPRFGELSLDSRAGALKVVTPGDVRASKLVKALRGELPAKMPPSGPLPEETIAAIEKWIQMGAPWPQGDAELQPRARDAAFNLEERKAAHWAWQPVKPVTPPPGAGSEIDRFINAKLAEAKLAPAPEAERAVMIRRLSFDLTGLPPKPEEVDAFVKSGDWPAAVDAYLGSPRFGERWARHWMDLTRYAESHGSEGDPDTPEAWRYRDYLIRAFNADVGVDQLIREHLAGDLLPHPRVDAAAGVNESILGSAHLRMVEHGFQPVDPWEDRVKWTDNQIDVLSKAFQGITVSCARCHDHKFDAISQKDFYALFGVLSAARPTQRVIDTPELLTRNRDEMRMLKEEIRKKLAAAWLEKAAGMEVWRGKIDVPAKPENFPNWISHGALGRIEPSRPGEFAILPAGGKVLNGIYPAGIYSHLLSNKHAAVLQSPRFKIETNAISFRSLGGNFSFAQLIIENYAVPRGGIYHLRHSPKKDEMGWHTWDTRFWKGFTAYLEFATLDDATHFLLDDEDTKAKPRPAPVRDGRSWWGVDQIVFHNEKEFVPPPPREVSVDVREAIHAWRGGNATAEQAACLDALVRAGQLPAAIEALPAVAPLAAGYRRLESEVPVARRAPGVIDEPGTDQPLLIRGNLMAAGDPVPRRYLEALGAKPYPRDGMMRLRLADEIASASNPLTARVMVNRIWSKLFGSGLVATVDNFGKLGETPSHPELLDWLAARLVEDGWSPKKTIRRMLMSDAYRRSSAASNESTTADPANRLLLRMPVRRLEAESIRDAMLAVSGALNLKMYGEGVPVYYAHDTGKTKGDRPKGPLNGDGRRSVYLEIRRNVTNPFLEVWDFPIPSTTRGARDLTNVPAQSLALMNGEFAREQAARWSENLMAISAEDSARLREMYRQAFGRAPSDRERQRMLAYVAELRTRHGSERDVWRDIAWTIFNLKEFVYIR
jgi:hypothetical protein